MNMKNLEFVHFENINPETFLPILNKAKLREHLMEHELFDFRMAKSWIKSKILVNANDGCKVRAINFKGKLIGWCGIQFENSQYEIAIVIDDDYWGQGRHIFNKIMCWASALGHHKIYIHFLDTRPKYKFLQKLSKRVFETEMYGNKFNTYELLVNTVKLD
jgi:RimJ/RimL family protein N-acetyltransferase